MRSATKYSAEQFCVARTPEVGQHWKGRLFPPGTGLHSQLPLGSATQPSQSIPASQLPALALATVPSVQVPPHQKCPSGLHVALADLHHFQRLASAWGSPGCRGGAAPELCCSRLAVSGLEISFKHQEPHNTAFKTIFKSREGKFKFTEVMEIPVSSTDAHLALRQELCDGPHEQPSSTPCKWCVNYYYILHLSTSQKVSV